MSLQAGENFATLKLLFSTVFMDAGADIFVLYHAQQFHLDVPEAVLEVFAQTLAMKI